MSSAVHDASPSPGRLRAAARAVRREAESMALFPELRRFSTPEERLGQVDAVRTAAIAADRALEARTWRNARARCRALPAHRRETVRREWERGDLPRTAAYYADLVHQVAVGRLDGDGYRAIPVSAARALLRPTRPMAADSELPGLTVDEPCCTP